MWHVPAVVLRLRHRGVLQPQAGASDVRFGGVSLHHRGEHPDHDTIANFRKRFLDELQGLFKQILVLAQALGVLRMGRVSLDGTKVQGNASKHQAMSWGHATKLERQLEGEVQTLLGLAERADQGEQEQQELDIPEELERREERLSGLVLQAAPVP